MTEDKAGLTDQSIGELFKSSWALTHRIHAIDKLSTRHPKGSPERKKCEADANDLREDREMIVREVERRCDKGGER